MKINSIDYFNKSTLYSIMLIISIFLSYKICNSQVNNKIITDSTSIKKAEILYIGIDNRVKITVPNVKKELLELTINQGTIVGESGYYIIHPEHSGDATVTVKENGKTISSQKYLVRLVPDPVATIKGLGHKTEYTREEIISAGGIEVYLPNFNIDISYEVLHFNISALINGIIHDVRQPLGNKFTEKQIELIENISSGKKFYIEDIQAKVPDGSVKSIAPLCIKIK